MVKNNQLQNFTMAGCPGSGKTSMARVLINELHAESIFIKCATEGNIDTLRAKVEPFCNAMTLDGRLKIILLDEVDAASGSAGNGSGFQSGLRTLIEAAQDDCRFILTCNYVNKIIPAVLSRCPLIPLKFDKKDLLMRVKFILDAEKIKYDRDGLKSFVEESFGFYPDCRRIINYLQFCCASGELVVKLNEVVDSDRRGFLDELMKKALTEKDILDVRRFYLANKDKISDYVAAGSDLFNAAVDDGLVDEDGILKLTDQIFMLNQVIDKECMFFGMIITLRKYKK